jgi:hypothetical protein
MTLERARYIARKLADARARSFDARAAGDRDGYRYAAAEARRFARILAEG